ncbi:hypothetical protein M0R45_035288 [Rubus argutus]|uniref:Homeobox domain-containing protein n=1 Tax=Rubus argutus TaxID=59490 RepID=A0AAW1VTI4_RUBAR
MARQVNSLDELLSSGPSESQIFEGLEEIIPSSVLYSLVASTPIVPPTRTRTATPIANPELNQSRLLSSLFLKLVHPRGNLQRTNATAMCRSERWEDFIAAHPTPTYDQKFLLSQQIGLPMKKVNKWITKHKAPVIQSDEQLIAELISRKKSPVPPPGVQQQPRVDVNPLQQEILEVYQKNPSIKNSFGGMHWNPCHLEINRDLLMTLLESLPKKYPASSEEPRTNSFHGYCRLSSVDPVIYRQQRLSSRNSKLFRVLAMSQRGCCTYFQSEASRHSATIRVSPITIVQTLMDVDQWLHIFCSLVTMLRSWRSCPLEKKRATRRDASMSAELCYQLQSSSS